MADKNEMKITDVEAREAALNARMEKLAAMEREIIKREKALKDKEKARKQVLLRLSPSLWQELAAWAEDDFRSINSQIEYLLAEAVKNRKKR